MKIIKGTSGKLKVNEKENIVIKKFNTKIGLKEGEKNELIQKKLKDIEGVKAPKIIEYDENKIVMKYIKSISFEKYYVKNLKNEKKIFKKLRQIAKALSSIHKINPDKKEEVFVHGDFHTKNILVEKETSTIVIIDAAGNIKRDKHYKDLATFMYHLSFKIPYKYYSLRAYLKSSTYIDYFLKQYSKYSKEEIDLKELNKFRIKTKQKYIKQIKKNKLNTILKYILIINLKMRKQILEWR